MAKTNRQRPLLTGPVRVRVSMVREAGMPVPEIVRTPIDASKYADQLRDSDRERFAVILLDIKNGALGLHVASVGTIDASLVSPVIVFRPAMLANAAAVLLTHNHISGDPTPSAEDIHITRKLVTAGKVMDIRVLDHVILGRTGAFLSMREKGVVGFE